MRRCALCGKSLEGRRSTAKYCSSPCRTTAFNRRAQGVVASAAGPSAAVVEAEADPDEPLMALVDVARELQRKLRSPNTPPTAVAGLAREYRVTLAEIERTAPRAKDGIDELLARRAARAASGA